MIKCRKIKAFTILELMVSIFITVTIVASFYKLYEASLKTERSSSIRVSVNLLGEQILDTVAESIRMIGLNSQKGDLTTTDYTSGIFRQSTLGLEGSGSIQLKYVSPYGSPVTKIASQPPTEESSTFPDSDSCKIMSLFNSAAFHNKVKKLYFHTQYGIVVTDANTTVSIGESTIGVAVNSFSTIPSGASGKACKDVLPAGTLVTGEDFIYTLSYNNSSTNNNGTLTETNSLTLTATDMDEKNPIDNSSNPLKVINFNYGGSSGNKEYSMPRFILQFLREKEENGTIKRTWVSSVAFSDIDEIIAVRFGFVILSKKERAYQGNDSPSGSNNDDLPKYCIFDENPCYELPSLNYTASVFRRVVYLSNLRLLKDSTKM